jgi:hypothetical protein
MNTSLKWLITASFINLVGNLLGAAITLQQNLAADWGSYSMVGMCCETLRASRGRPSRSIGIRVDPACDRPGGTATRSVDVPFCERGHCRRNGDLASGREQVRGELQPGSPIQTNTFRYL